MTYSPPTLAFERLSVSVDSSHYAELGGLALATPASAAYPAANLGIFVPIYIEKGVVVQQIYWQNGGTITGTTSVEAALYDEGGTTKLLTSGVVTHAGVSVPQATAISGGLYLPRGRYWMGIVCGNNTSTFFRWTNAAASTNIQKMIGTSEQALGSTALPASITFGPASNAYIPVMGLSLSTLTM